MYTVSVHVLVASVSVRIYIPFKCNLLSLSFHLSPPSTATVTAPSLLHVGRAAAEVRVESQEPSSVAGTTPPHPTTGEWGNGWGGGEWSTAFTHCGH